MQAGRNKQPLVSSTTARHKGFSYIDECLYAYARLSKAKGTSFSWLLKLQAGIANRRISYEVEKGKALEHMPAEGIQTVIKLGSTMRICAIIGGVLHIRRQDGRTSLSRYGFGTFRFAYKKRVAQGVCPR